MALTNKYLEVNFGTNYSGLATVGYELVDNTGATVVARTTTGVFEIETGSGAYGVVVPTIANNVASIVWDTGGGSPVYATEAIEIYHQLENLDTPISSLNDLSIADVQTAMTNQGYTSARAALLDNLDNTISSVLAAIAALNDLSISDVQTALNNQGYTALRATLLDRLDATVSSRATDVDVWTYATRTLTSFGTLVSDIQTALDAAHGSGSWETLDDTAILAAIAALNDLSIADVQTALTNQGYTAVRAALLDNLDAAISSVLTAIAALNDLSQADVQSAMTAQGYTTVRAALIDNLDAAISTVATLANQIAMQSDIDFIKDIEGGRWIIDETTNEMLFYKADNTTLIARFDLKDINGNPAYLNVFERVRGTP